MVEYCKSLNDNAKILSLSHTIVTYFRTMFNVYFSPIHRETRRLIIPPHLAYGDRGVEGAIPGGDINIVLHPGEIAPFSLTHYSQRYAGV